MSEYCPIDCDFYDQPEALATLRQSCHLIYRNAAGETIEVHDRIVDLYAANKAEFLKLNHDVVIRLDRLVSVNGQLVPFAQE